MAALRKHLGNQVGIPSIDDMPLELERPSHLITGLERLGYKSKRRHALKCFEAVAVVHQPPDLLLDQGVCLVA